MKTFEAGFEGPDGLHFHVQGWEPESAAKAEVALIHGLGEHVGRWPHFGAALTAAGYALIGFDLRGHGRSGGARGHMPSLQAAVQDIDAFLAYLTRRQASSRPRFLYGHSLGGLLTLAYTLQQQPAVRGVVVTSPGLRSALQEQKFKILLARTLGSLTPALTLASGLDPRTISRDPQVVEAYIHDPLVHDRMTTGFGKTGLAAIDFAFANASHFSVPLLVMCGSQDRLTYPSGAQDFVRQVPGDATFKLWDGLYHELHNEPEQGQVFAFVIRWLDAHLKGR